jgi:hypothetical protein
MKAFITEKQRASFMEWAKKYDWFHTGDGDTEMYFIAPTGECVTVYVFSGKQEINQ